jgi:magnesium-transporting ATPase (P-type)
VRASAAANGDDPALQADAQARIVPKFHWTMLTPYLYTALLVYMSTLAGNFSISGAVFFILFLLHSFAYYGYRIYDDPIDMLTDKRRYNKSLFLRRLFLWLFVLVGITYFVGVIFVRVSYDYEDGKLVHLENKESLKQDMIALERSMSKIIPDFLSNWTIFRAVLVLVFAIGLIFIQWSEEAYAEVNDEALMTVYTDIYREKWQKVGQNG